MSLDTEIQGDTTSFEFFDRSWTIPSRRHHSHIREIKQVVRTEGALDGDDVARIFLSPDQYTELVELDVTEGELREFASKLGDALGLEGSGNSEPSASSS